MHLFTRNGNTCTGFIALQSIIKDTICDFIKQHLAATDVTGSDTKFSLHRQLLKDILAAFTEEERNLLLHREQGQVVHF